MSDKGRKVYVDVRRVAHNLRAIKRLVWKQKHRLVVSTKGICMNKDILRGLSDADVFYDTDLENVRLILESGKKAISSHALYSNRHSVVASNFRELSRLKKGEHSDVYLFFNFGDEREGFFMRDIERIASVLTRRGIKHVSIMSIIGCLSTKKPTASYFRKFKITSERLENQGIQTNLFSIGGSNCLPFLDSYPWEKPIEIRVGYAVFFGNYESVPPRVLPLQGKNISMEARVLKKISRSTFLLDFGYSTLHKSQVELNVIKVLTQSTDYSVASGSRLVESGIVKIPITYEGLSILSKMNNVSMHIV